MVPVNRRDHPPVMGGIVERVVDTSAPIAPMRFATVGFPTKGPSALQYQSKDKAASSSSTSSSSSSSSSSLCKASTTSTDIELYKKYVEEIAALPIEETKELTSDTMTMLSQKSIDFLLKRSIQMSVEKDRSSSIDVAAAADGNSIISYDKFDCPNAPSPSGDKKQSESYQMVKSGSRKVIKLIASRDHVDLHIVPDDYIAATETELFTKLNAAPIEVKKNVAWINSNKISTTAATESSTTIPVKADRLSIDRFNLDGKLIVIDRDAIKTRMVSDLRNSSFLDNLNTDSFSEIADQCIEKMIAVGFAIDGRLLAMDEDVELFNHQLDGHLPGYTINDICEMYRSEVPMQRSLSLRMLSGVLHCRDSLVDSECAGYHSTLAANSAFETSLRFDKKLFYNQYKDIVSSVSVKLHAATNQTIKYATLKKVRRVLTYILQYLCISDLPANLPVMLLWGFGSRSCTSPAIRLATMQCLNSFLHSSFEEQSAEQLWSYLSLGSASPVLTTPHARRDETSYEVHHAACIKKFEEMKEQKGNEDKASNISNLPHNEWFAYLCRWDRINAFAHYTDIIERLSSVVSEYAPVLVNTNSAEAGEIIGLQSIHQSLLILCHFSRLGDIYAAAAVKKCVVSSLYSTMSPIITDIYGNTGIFIEPNSMLSRIIAAWWRLLAELGVKDPAIVAWIWEETSMQPYIILSPTVKCSSHRNDEAAWRLRLWRVSLVRGFSCSDALVMLPALVSDSLCVGNRDVAVLYAHSAHVIARCFAAAPRDGDDLDHLLDAAIQLVAIADILIDSPDALKESWNLHLLSTILGLSLRDDGSCICFGLIPAIQSLKQRITTGSRVTALDAAVAKILSRPVEVWDALLLSIFDDLQLLQSCTVDAARDYNTELLDRLDHMLCSKKLICSIASHGLTGQLPRPADTCCMMRSLDICEASQAEGLLAWKCYSLVQCEIIVNLTYVHIQHHRRHVYASFWRDLVFKALCSLGQRHVAAVTYLLKEATAFLLFNVIDVPEDKRVAIENSLILQCVGEDAATSLAVSGNSISTFPAIYIATFSNCLECSTLTHSFGDSHTSPSLPLNRLWVWNYLQTLQGHYFSMWLVAMTSMQSEIDIASGKVLYLLLRMLKPVNATKWFDHDSLVPISEGIAAYTTLLMHNTKCKYFHGKSQSLAFTQSFIAACTEEVSDTMAAIKSKREKRMLKDTELGPMKLCEELMVAALGEHVSSDLHSLSLVLLISPLMPMSVREVVWREVGSLRLLHLFEGDHFGDSVELSLLPMFLLEADTHDRSENLATIVLKSLLNLRGDSDRCFTICSIGLMFVGIYLFGPLTSECGYDSATVTMNTGRSTLLSHIIRNVDMYPDWIVLRLFYVYHNMKSLRASYCNGHSVDEELWATLSNEMYKLIKEGNDVRYHSFNSSGIIDSNDDSNITDIRKYILNMNVHTSARTLINSSGSGYTEQITIVDLMHTHRSYLCKNDI